VRDGASSSAAETLNVQTLPIIKLLKFKSLGKVLMRDVKGELCHLISEKFTTIKQIKKN